MLPCEDEGRGLASRGVAAGDVLGIGELLKAVGERRGFLRGGIGEP